MEPKNHRFLGSRLILPPAQLCLCTTGALGDWPQFRGWILPTMWLKKWIIQRTTRQRLLFHMTRFSLTGFATLGCSSSTSKAIKFMTRKSQIYSMIRLMLNTNIINVSRLVTIYQWLVKHASAKYFQTLKLTRIAWLNNWPLNGGFEKDRPHWTVPYVFCLETQTMEDPATNRRASIRLWGNLAGRLLAVTGGWGMAPPSSATPIFVLIKQKDHIV